MSGTKNTLGPWAVRVEEQHYVTSAEGRIANVLFPRYSADGVEVMANARMIAAAPELLEELEYVRTTLSLLRTAVRRSEKVDHLWDGMDEKFAEWLARIDTAIAKAVGP